LYVKSL